MIPTLPASDLKRRSVVLAGGGMDSAVALAWLASVPGEVQAMHFDYGQKTEAREGRSVELLCQHLGLRPPVLASIPSLQSLVDHPMLDPTQALDTRAPRRAYVPFRNTVFLSLAAAWAEHHGFTHVVIGSHASDRVCPDNSRAYVSAYQRMVEVAQLSSPAIRIDAPFVSWTKAQVVELGRRLKLPFELTWSCYNNLDTACGVCGNCRDRRTAFDEAGATDPIAYEVAT